MKEKICKTSEFLHISGCYQSRACAVMVRQNARGDEWTDEKNTNDDHADKGRAETETTED